MACKVVPGTLTDGSERAREAVCIHTRKIFDACQSKDCGEELCFYPTETANAVLSTATSVRGGCAELLRVYVNVEPICFDKGYYTVDMQYYYRVTLQAYQSTSARPTAVEGLSVFDKRCILYGSDGSSKSFSSLDPEVLPADPDLPEAVVEVINPLVLAVHIPCENRGSCASVTSVPDEIAEAFASPLMFSGLARRICVTLGQFSIVRLERDTQLLIPAYDYCMPEKSCTCDSGGDDPCDMFSSVCFPVSEFFPPNAADRSCGSSYTAASGCCSGSTTSGGATPT